MHTDEQNIKQLEFTDFNTIKLSWLNRTKTIESPKVNLRVSVYREEAFVVLNLYLSTLRTGGLCSDECLSKIYLPYYAIKKDYCQSTKDISDIVANFQGIDGLDKKGEIIIEGEKHIKLIGNLNSAPALWLDSDGVIQINKIISLLLEANFGHNKD